MSRTVPGEGQARFKKRQLPGGRVNFLVTVTSIGPDCQHLVLVGSNADIFGDQTGHGYTGNIHNTARIQV